MSRANSGASTPTPEPSPLKVGIGFVGQYYQTLSTTPDQIFRFYQPTSFLSQGVGSHHSDPFTLEEQQQADLQGRFYLPVDTKQCPIRFEFEDGAIDAQPSMNGGVLLVVTGEIVYLNEDDDEEKHRHAFVHTFFLASFTAGTKRSYYVHNDVLRFLHVPALAENEEVVAEGEPIAPAEVPYESEVAEPATAVVEETTPAPEKENVAEAETAAIKVDDSATNQKDVNEQEEAPGNGVEESKETLLVDEEAATDTASVEKNQPPGSWASMVAKTRTPASNPPTPASTPVRPSKASTPTAAPAKSTAPSSSPTKGGKTAIKTTEQQAAKPRPGRRDPDCTLVIRNVPEGTIESEILGLFEAFAVQTDAKIVNTTVSPHKGIAFVDYDSAAPVVAAVEQHEKEPFRLKDRMLDIYQKTVEQQKGRRPGSNKVFRGGNGSNGNSHRGGGGRQGRRGGRGDRSKSGGRGGVPAAESGQS